MNSPEGYKKENDNKSIEELVLERTKLFNAIVEYEKKHIIGNEPFNYEEIAKPSAKDIYNMDNSYLKEITDLIIEKAKQKKFEDYMYKVANDATMDTSWIKEMTEKDNSNNIPICPNCNGKLTFMMPDGKTLYCNSCNKYFINNNGIAGDETGSPYTRNDVLY